MNEPGVENACCEFDTKTLQPTYKLLIGVPGVSNAFVISGRLGLSPEIIDRARSLISEEGQRFEELVSAIEESHREAREIEEKIARLEDEAIEANERLAMTREKLEKEHDKVLESAREEAALLLEAAREEIDRLLLETKGQSVDHRVASEARGRLSQISKKYQMRKKTPDIPEGPLTAETLVLGKKYRSRSLSIDGVVRALPDAKGQVVLEAGSFRVTVPLSDLTLVRASGKKKADKKTSATQASSLRSDIVMRAGAELMLLGKRADEALNLLDQFIDDAMLAGLSPVRIVHGKGTGALRKATHESLSRDRRVETFRLGGEGEGGDGVTVVTLKL
jgi:DNA mismatch repair protein MutS2